MRGGQMGADLDRVKDVLQVVRDTGGYKRIV